MGVQVLHQKLFNHDYKVGIIPIFGVKLGRQITNFFQWSWNIADRLAFIEIFSGKEDFSINYRLLDETFKIKPDELLSVDNYFKEYFKQILTKLKVLNF